MPAAFLALLTNTGASLSLDYVPKTIRKQGQ